VALAGSVDLVIWGLGRAAANIEGT